MRKLLLSILIPLVVIVPNTTVNTPVEASPADQYSGPYFGDTNLPPGCEDDDLVGVQVEQPEATRGAGNVCYHMRTDMNGLDSPQVDVLVLVPVSPTAERDMRIMRQSVEMWEGGIEYLAPEMGLDWLADGMDFHITVQYLDPAGEGSDEFTTYPIVDPEIVVIATNPVGGIGIGIDPVDFIGALEFTDEDEVPCHNVSNPFDFEYWDSLPGFNNHHDRNSGTYVEDCGGAGGNICFAINGAIDPANEVIDFFGLYDLVSHEFGHCMTIGHVGDGAEGSWKALPSNDIMAYSQDPPGLNKCVSTLDVEGVALRMSKYLDVDRSGDNVRDDGDLLLANDMAGDGPFGNPFQVQHPRDHLYASGTGDPMDCPQPDIGPVPAATRTDWIPTPVSEITEPELAVISPADGTESDDGIFDVTGTVEHVALNPDPPEPTEPTGSFDDADDDASAPITEIKALDVAVTTTHVEATIRLADLWPSTSATSPTSYSVIVNGRKFDSFVRYPTDPNPMTWDNGVPGYMPAGTSSWDLVAKTVRFRIPRAYLAAATIESPYYVGSSANFGSLTATVVDDSAPEGNETVGVAGALGPDRDGDGVADSDDACPDEVGYGPDGCPGPVTGQVEVYVDGVIAATQGVRTAFGPDSFDLTVTVAEGTHQLRVEWDEGGEVIGSESVDVTRVAASGGGVVADFDGDGDTDRAVFRPSNNSWYINGQPAVVAWGLSGDIPVPVDYNNDGVTDIAVFRPSNGSWYINGQPPVVQWGKSGDIPVPGDYDGDGTTDLAVFRPSNGSWYVQDQPLVQLGLSGDIPVPGDYDNDGATERAVFRPSTGAWYVEGQSLVQWGKSGDIPVPGDYGGDGFTDRAVFRPSNGSWYVQGQSLVQLGLSGDIPAPGDYDNDGITERALFRPSTGAWYVEGQALVQFGKSGDIPANPRASINKAAGLY